MFKWLIFILLAVIFPLSSQAASTWRCQGGLVSKGNSQVEVVDRCGTPSARNFLGWRRAATGYWGTFRDEQVEEWVYPMSSTLFYVLKFEGGRLVDVKSHYEQ